MYERKTHVEWQVQELYEGGWGIVTTPKKEAVVNA